MRPSARLAALAPVATLVMLSCGPKAPPDAPPKDPPRVFVTVAESDVVGTQFKLSISVTGCDAVNAVQLYDHTSLIKVVEYGPTPTPVTLAMNELPWPSLGFAGNLSLRAQAFCMDGRSNTSTAVPAVFFPVEKVVSLGGAQVVTDNFVVDGREPLATFSGCSGGAQPGTTMLATVDQAGAVTKTQQALPVPCDLTSAVTPRNGPSGKRWMWTAGLGAFAFDAGLAVSGHREGKVHALAVMPNGDAVTWDRTSPSGGLQWRSHQDASLRWAINPLGQLAGSPQLRQGFGLYVPVLTAELTGEATFRVHAVNEQNGGTVGTYDQLKWTVGLGDTAYVPQTAFNADASVVYVPVPLPAAEGRPAGTSQVWACPTAQTGGCNVNSRKWVSPELPGTPVSAVVPFNGGTRLAAIAPNGTWFLDALTGEVQNQGGRPLEPSGGLVTLGYEKGLTGPDFYLFNGSLPRPGEEHLWVPLYTEIVGTDAPGAGELFRYTLLSGSLSGALDDEGRLWLRVGPNLVKPLPLAQYRYVAPARP
ncbi:MAG: hypothetical protein RL653_1988 [Pseudomonadota bacterium]|jgi:hypothetical protein